MTLPKTNPTAFCKAFIQRELVSCQESKIWMSYWPVMGRMIERADELRLAFGELISRFGYSDKFEGFPPQNSYIWLSLEHIWMSTDFCKEEVIQTRREQKELLSLQEEIVHLASKLAATIRRQNELYETSGFIRNEYQSLVDAVEFASNDNYLYGSHLSGKIRALAGQYDLKYWPSRADVIEAIADFEDDQPKPLHSEIPQSVLDGRASDIKDFVLAFDNKFDDLNGLPDGFRFSNNAMADIINVVLELSPDKLATGDAVRIVRNRHS
ncbi:hypothetical protein [Vibrio vulnificus]|uniref:hypothetical protein n=1 Tax=Vibrio vulnificus TaxID=672 RepID=UPI00102A7AF1|nr:hypothetical protein [Vibrio vulnificus]RZQ97110.1 hypothetical protein D8T25_19355 [Vibrio vulnificus]